MSALLLQSLLRGRAQAAIGNGSKRFLLYKKFWQVLKDLGVWRCEKYLEWKSQRTSRDDPRENAKMYCDGKTLHDRTQIVDSSYSRQSCVYVYVCKVK